MVLPGALPPVPPSMITFYDFHGMNIQEKADAIWQGQYIGSCIEGESTVQLYNLCRFYAEVFYNAKSNEIKKIRAFNYPVDRALPIQHQIIIVVFANKYHLVRFPAGNLSFSSSFFLNPLGQGQCKHCYRPIKHQADPFHNPGALQSLLIVPQLWLVLLLQTFVHRCHSSMR